MNETYIQKDDVAADEPSEGNKNTLISSRSAPDGMEFELINPGISQLYNIKS